MSYTAELIAVGTELLLGNISNTDAQMISQGLSAIGINVYYHTVVGDNPARLRSAVDIAKDRADIIITTGGLGPTCDDLTKQTLAATFGLPLVFHEPSADRITDYFRRLHPDRPMTGKTTSSRPCCPRAAPSSTTTGVPLPAAPLPQVASG